MIEIGKRAPAFTLPDQDDVAVKLSELAGPGAGRAGPGAGRAGRGGQWVVLYFYPKDDTPGCTIEACDFTAGIKAFEKLDAVVLGCSPDSTESHRKFAAKHKLKVRLLSDSDHKVMEKYGAWGEKTLYGRKSVGVIRSTVLIDPDGKVAHHWARARAKGHADAVRAKLQELRG
jgi:peroxiredoxin Q/BCP